MELDIAALQRLPEVIEASGLDLLPVPICVPGTKTRLVCNTPTCGRTQIVISTPPGQ
ncbi:MAG TPA: hypothetical protein VMU51_26500 [Mycobacteriales bacterium]|nr:hypothetical protein [Mycobacteriales bacterium]